MAKFSPAALLAAAVTACTGPGPHGGSILIDHAGFVGRWRRACELEKASSTEGSCTQGDGAPSESEESELDGSGAPDDPDASDGSNFSYGYGVESIEPARDRP